MLHTLLGKWPHFWAWLATAGMLQQQASEHTGDSQSAANTDPGGAFSGTGCALSVWWNTKEGKAMREIQLTVRTLTNDPYTGESIAWLEGVHGKVVLPFVVRGTSAMSIYLSLSGERGPRPLTHDLIISCLGQFQARIQEVRFAELQGGVLDAQIVVTTAEKQLSLRARSSDAIALALKSDAPIFLSEEVLSELGLGVALTQAGARNTNPLGQPQPAYNGEGQGPGGPEALSDVRPDDEEGTPPDGSGDSRGRLRQLESQLEEAVRHERYEKAGVIKQQIISIRQYLRHGNG